jgi:hypothetical protein
MRFTSTSKISWTFVLASLLQTIDPSISPCRQKGNVGQLRQNGISLSPSSSNFMFSPSFMLILPVFYASRA